jgi:Rrf2 family transcriptional regulator, iron-sulfur cluster assembly transcription factor
MVSQSGEYALRAVLHIARQRGPVTVDAVAEAVGAPRNYLHKVMYVLAKRGVLASTRGPAGGFTVGVAPERLRLAEVVEPFDALRSRARCVLGASECPATAPCTAHAHWEAVAEAIAVFFEKTTVADLLHGSAAPVPHAVNAANPMTGRA